MTSELHPNWQHNTQLQIALKAVAYGVYFKYHSMFCANTEVQTATHVPLICIRPVPLLLLLTLLHYICIKSVSLLLLLTLLHYIRIRSVSLLLLLTLLHYICIRSVSLLLLPMLQLIILPPLLSTLTAASGRPEATMKLQYSQGYSCSSSQHYGN